MPKWGSFLSLNTAAKVSAGAALGYFGTVVVSNTGSAEDPTKAEVREERREEREKRLNFEVQQRSNELDKREQSLKTQEEALLKREAALREERLAMQSMQASTVAVTEETAGAVAAKTVQIVEEPTDLKIEQHKTVVATEKPTEYVPKRPAVFDGRGNAPVVTNKSSTNGAEPQLLYFNDPSFATDRVPSTDGRDGLRRPLLSPTDPNARRFANLRPQHVVSVKATPEGIVVEEGRTGAFSLSSETRLGTVSTASDSGAPKTDEKGDATVVALHDHDPKPPFGGKGAVSEAERNAFDEEKQLFAKQKEGFKREKSEKERELAGKTKDLKDREALYGKKQPFENLEPESSVSISAGNTSGDKKEDLPLSIKKDGEIFYETEEGTDGRSDKAKAYEIDRGAELEISAQKPGFFSRTFRWFGGLFGNKSGAGTGKPFVMQSAGDFEINGVKAEGSVHSEDEYEEMMTKEQLEEFNRSLSGEAAAKDWKNTIETRHTDNFLVDGDAQKMLDAAAYELDTQDGLIIIPLGRHPGEKTLYIENDRFAISAKPKGKLLWEPRDGVTISAKERKPLESVHTNKIEVRDSKSNKKIYEVSQGDQFMISATEGLKKLKEDLRELGEKLQTAQSKLNNNVRQNKKVRELTERWKEQTAEWKATRLKLEALLTIERVKGEISTKKAQEAKKQLSELQLEVVKLKKEITSLKTNAHILEDQALKATAEKDAALGKAKTEQEKSQRLTKANNGLKEQVEMLNLELESNNEVYEANRQEFLDEKQNMQKELFEVQGNYDEVRGRLQTVVSQRDILKQRNEQLSQDLKAVNDEKFGLRQENGSLRFDKLQLESKNEKLESDVLIKNNDLRRLNAELEAKSRFNNLKKSAGSIEIKALKKPGSRIEIAKVSNLEVKPKSKAELSIETRGKIEVLPKPKTPYVLEKQNMAIERQPELNLQKVAGDQSITAGSKKTEMVTVGTQTPKLRPPFKTPLRKEKKDAAEAGTELKVLPQTQITLQGVAKPEEEPKKIKITTKKVVRKTDVLKRKFDGLESETTSVELPGSKQKKAVFVSKEAAVQPDIKGEKQPFGDLAKENLLFDLEAKKQKPVLKGTTEAQFMLKGVQKEQKEASVQAGSSLELEISKSGEVNVKKAKKIRVKESETATEVPKFEISKMETVTAEAKKPEKRDDGTEPVKPELKTECPLKLTVDARPKAKLIVEKGERIDVLPKPKTPYVLEKQDKESMTIERQSKPENEIQKVDNFVIIRKEKPENAKKLVDEIAIEAPEKPRNIVQTMDGIMIAAQPQPKTFGKLEKGNAANGEVIGDGSKLREAEKKIREAEEKIGELESELGKLKVQSFISEIEKEDKLEWNEEDEKQMEKKFLEEMQNAANMRDIILRLVRILAHAAKRSQTAADEYCKAVPDTDNKIKYKKRTIKGSKNSHVDLKIDESGSRRICLQKFDSIASSLKVYTKIACDQLLKLYRPKGLTAKQTQKQEEKKDDKEKALELGRQEEKLRNLEKKLRTKEADLTARGKRMSDYERRVKSREDELQKQKVAQEKILKENQESLKEKDKRIKEQSDELIEKANKYRNLTIQVQSLNSQANKNKSEAERKEKLLEQKESEIAELRKKIESAERDKKTIENLRADLEESKKAYGLLKSSYDQLKEKHEQQTQSDQSKPVSWESHKKLRDEKLKIEKKCEKLYAEYEEICGRHSETVKCLDKTIKEKRMFQNGYNTWRAKCEEMLNARELFRQKGQENEYQKQLNEWEKRCRELLKEKYKVTELLNMQQDVCKEKAIGELTMSWNNRGNNYDNDDFGGACGWSKSNISLANFNDLKASVVKKITESVSVTTRNEKKLLNTFVNALDEVWDGYAGNNVVRDLNREGAFDDSEEKEFKNLFDNGKRKDNFKNSFNPTPNRNEQNTRNTIYDRNPELKKAGTGVKNGGFKNSGFKHK